MAEGEAEMVVRVGDRKVYVGDSVYFRRLNGSGWIRVIGMNAKTLGVVDGVDARGRWRSVAVSDITRVQRRRVE